MLEINVGAGPSVPLNTALAEVGGVLYLGASDGVDGFELWKSDGTVLGTDQVKDIQPMAGSSHPLSLVDFNGTLFFTADDGEKGKELWKSDGTVPGTERVADINPDGADAFDPSLDTEMEVVGSTLFFPADDGTHGVELWKTDGTEAGTMLVKDINGTGDSNPMKLTRVGGTLFFVADDGINGRELWESNGTSDGTTMVADLAPGLLSAFFPLATDNHVVAFDGSLFFAATDGDQIMSGIGVELWRTVASFVDDDEDGMDDDWEDANGLDSSVDDADGDLDMDGVTNLDEFLDELDPRDPDTDGDGIGDAFDDDPLPSNACVEDVDGDATLALAVPASTTLQCAAGNSITVAPDVEVSGVDGRLELISPAVSIGEGFAVPTGAELEVVSADPVPGTVVPH
jgi:ELWxxDGT repeat protein